jgi:hypothetical protein
MPLPYRKSRWKPSGSGGPCAVAGDRSAMSVDATTAQLHLEVRRATQTESGPGRTRVYADPQHGGWRQASRHDPLAREEIRNLKRLVSFGFAARRPMVFDIARHLKYTR